MPVRNECIKNSDIKKHYLSGLTLREIGELLNCDYGTVYYRLKTMGVQRRNPGHYNKQSMNRPYKGYSNRHMPATSAVSKAIKDGILIRPNKCEDCGATPKNGKDGRPGIQAHHDNYNQYLNVRWLCIRCHKKWHRENIAIDYHLTKLTIPDIISHNTTRKAVMEDLGHTMDVKEATEFFKCSRQNIVEMIKNGMLLAEQPGGSTGKYVIPTNQPIIQRLLNPEVTSEEQIE